MGWPWSRLRDDGPGRPAVVSKTRPRPSRLVDQDVLGKGRVKVQPVRRFPARDRHRVFPPRGHDDKPRAGTDGPPLDHGSGGGLGPILPRGRASVDGLGVPTPGGSDAFPPVASSPAAGRDPQAVPRPSVEEPGARRRRPGGPGPRPTPNLPPGGAGRTRGPGPPSRRNGWRQTVSGPLRTSRVMTSVLKPEPSGMPPVLPIPRRLGPAFPSARGPRPAVRYAPSPPGARVDRGTGPPGRPGPGATPPR